MSKKPFSLLLRHLREVIDERMTVGVSEGELLRRFAEHRDETAFASLVERHGAMVLGVCRHVLRHEQEAEDAFQATFLVLARKAAVIRKQQSVASWLHGVAYRTALNSRKMAMRRHKHERRSGPRTAEPAAATAAFREMQALLDEEVQSLAEKYRAPFVLCCLEGKNRAEAAQELGCKEGTVFSRVARARALLRQRLMRRGVALTTALAAYCVAEKPAQAALAVATVRAARLFVTGDAATISASVITLAKTTLKGMVVTQLKATSALLVTLSLLVGASIAAHRSLAGVGLLGGLGLPPDQPAEQPPHRKAEAAKPQPAVAGPRRNPATPRTDIYGDPLPPMAVVRMGSTRFRHGGCVNAVAASPDGTTIASAGADNSVRIWEAATGKELRRLAPRQGPFAPGTPVYAVAFSPDGRFLASGTDTIASTVRLWDANSGKELARFSDLRFSVKSLVFSPDGRYLIGGGGDKKVCIWDLKGDKAARLFDGQVESIQALAISPDGNTLACCGDGISVFDPATGKVIRQLKGQKEKAGVRPRFTAIIFSRDGSKLVSGEHGNIRVWETATGRELQTIATDHFHVLALAFTADGRFLGSCGYAGGICIWQTTTWKRVRTIPGHSTGTLALAFTRDGKTLVSGGQDQTVRLHEVTSGKEIRLPPGHQDAVCSVAFSADGKMLASGGFHSLRLWETTTGKEIRQVHNGDRLLHLTGLVAFTPDRRYLVTAAETIRRWDLQAGKELPRLVPKSSYVGPAAVAADGKTVAAMEDDKVVLWELATGKEKARFPGGRTVRALAFSADGRYLASGTMFHGQGGPAGAATATVWDTRTGKRLWQFQVAEKSFYVINGLAFSPDGKLLVARVQTSRLEEQTRVWDAATGKELPPFQGPISFAWSMAFSPDGKTFATGGWDIIRLWEVASRQVRLTLRGDQGAVHSLAFSPDGRRLASAGNDTTALVWDLRAGESTGLLSAADLNRIWSDLAGDAAKAYHAIGALAAAPEHSVPFLKTQLRPVVPVPRRQMDHLRAGLDSDNFRVREKAARELEGLNESAEPDLRRALAKPLSAEVRQRVERILQTLEKTKLRENRAVEALENMAGPQARELLAGLAQGTPDAQLTREARASLGRLSR